MKRWATPHKPFTWLKEKFGREQLANRTRLRLTHQLIITFATIVLVPLLGVSFIIYSINQTALRKELLKFTENTAQTIYKDFNTEMGWQQEQSQMMAFYLLDNLPVTSRILEQSVGFNKAAQGIFRLSPDTEAVGLYAANGQALQRSYRHWQNLPQSLMLPDRLGDKTVKRASTLHSVYDIVYVNAPVQPDPNDNDLNQVIQEPQTQAQKNKWNTPYYLRICIPINTKQTLQGQAPAYYVQLKPFRYLATLIQDHRSIYESFYIIDDTGLILAGPNRQDIQRTQISTDDYAYFKSIEPGVTHELANQQPTVPEAERKALALARSRAPHRVSNDDSDEAPPLEKVIVKMPDTHWGIIIESPYHVRQKYIKRANEQSLLLIVACVAITILLAMVYIYGINRNFRQLIKGIKAMAEGNYFRRIRLITNFFTPYEIVYLTGEFNRMAKRRAEAWETIEQANHQLAKLDELKSNLIDTVSHELRTPLTNIKGYTSRLLRYDDTLDKETRLKSLKTIKQQSDRLSRLVDDLLVIPELEKTTLRVFPDEVFLPDLLERCVQFAQAKDQRDMRIVYGEGVKGLAVLADPDRLEQIVLNLLDNAVKYSIEETPVSILVKALPHGMVKITVSNEAEFINETALQTLFDKFQRLDDSTVRTTRGSGLGLFITKGLVEAMSGTISVLYNEGLFQIEFTLPQYREILTY